MAALQSHNLLSSSSPPTNRLIIRATLNRKPTNFGTRRIPLPNVILTTMDELTLKQEHPTNPHNHETVAKLYAIAEAVSDRAEMHDIIGKQRDNWGHHFLNSVNSITLTASIMAGISSFPAAGGAASAFKVSSAILYAAATGIMIVTNKIQPSQLAEEQRNAARLFRQLEKSIHTTLALRSSPTELDVKEALNSVLALDKAYPLALTGMLDKFPKMVEPTVWWKRKESGVWNISKPMQTGTGKERNGTGKERNGWSKEVEEEMYGALRVLKTKDVDNYLALGRLVLPMNKTLAISGPLLAGLAAVGAGLIGSSDLGHWPLMLAVVGGSLAAVVNSLEHGGQVGMVFELARNCAGNYLKLQEEIEANLEERDVEKREDGDLFEMKMALQLGRSLSELKDLSKYASPTCKNEDINEFAGKLY